MPFIRVIFLYLVLIASTISLPNISLAVTYNVDRQDDPTPIGECRDDTAMDCSLREAIINANNHVGYDLVMIPAGTYVLTRTGTLEDAAIIGDLDITEAAVLQGAGMNLTIIEGGGASGMGERILQVYNAPGTEIHDLTIQGGYLGIDAGGAAILAQSNVTIDSVRMRNNEAEDGGAVYVSHPSAMTILNSEILDNLARLAGGGIKNTSTLSVISSTISGNRAYEYGGGINNVNSINITTTTISGNEAWQGGGLDNSGSVCNVTDSFITGNMADSPVAVGLGGGGVLNWSGTAVILRTLINNNQAIKTKGGGVWNAGVLTLDHVTMDGNTTDEEAAAIEQNDGTLTIISSTVTNHHGGSANVLNLRRGTTSIVNSTISGNSTTAGNILSVADPASLTANHVTFFDNNASLAQEIWTNNGAGTTVELQNSIIQGSCFGDGYQSSGGNVMGPSFGCGLSEEAGDVVLAADMKLGPLSDNGGETLTHMPLEGSIVIDRGLNKNCLELITDQRDLLRMVDTLGAGARCDSGAVEVQPVIQEELIFENSFEENGS